MDGIRHQVEASVSRAREVIMEDRYRRLHLEPTVVAAPHYWAQPAPTKRFKRHLPAIPKKSTEYPKHYKDKYGSVSAHSTSAIYGALRAPHCHAMYGPSDMWYASVRSLNSRPRDLIYPAEAYEWREDVTREMCAVSPKVELAPRPACVCMIRMKLPHESSTSHSKNSRHQPRCKYCANGFSTNGLLKDVPSPSKRTLPISEKMKPSSTEEKMDTKPESTGRMSSYKKGIPCSTLKYKNPAFTKVVSSKDPSILSRKSILECDVTAYDLIRKVAKTPSVSEIEDSDVDDDLSDNAISKLNQSRLIRLQNKTRSKNSSPCGSQISNRKSSPKFRNFQNEICVYSESPSVLVGGQRIFTENNRSKSPETNNTELHDKISLSREPQGAKWGRMSLSEESICIPDPDYDFSDDSDEGTVISSKHRDPKFTYSPPTLRKPWCEPQNGLIYSSREISKSMSSLQSEDTIIPNISINNSYTSSPSLKAKNCTESFDCDTFNERQHVSEDIEIDISDVTERMNESVISSPTPSRDSSIIQDIKYDSSSDCSSSGGTLSSDYPTWTSSSSNELKSILKKKRKRDNAIQELGDATRVFLSFKSQKEAQKKKQVQFRPGSDTGRLLGNVPNGSLRNECEENGGKNSEDDSDSDGPYQVPKDVAVTLCDTYVSLSESLVDKEFNLPQAFESTFTPGEAGSVDARFSPACSPAACSPSLRLDDLVASAPPRTLGLSSSLEDVAACKGSKRRRFSELLLCPSGGSLCGDGSSSDDVPLTTTRAHRSLPESPSELGSSFCFDFATKGKMRPSSRSVFYVSVDGQGQRTAAFNNVEALAPSVENEWSPSKTLNDESEDNLSPEQYDTDEDNLENDYENLDPIYEELSDISNSSKRLCSLASKQKSFFEGASKIDILSYLEGAKERGISEGLSENVPEEDEEEKLLGEGKDDEKSRVIVNNNINYKEVLLTVEEDPIQTEHIEPENPTPDTPKSSEVERNDSGVGAETSKPARHKVAADEQSCADCDRPVEIVDDDELFVPLVCRACELRRAERKEIIIEFVDTELKYGRDLRIVKEEFYRPMEIAGLLMKEQLLSIFLNLDELSAVNMKFSEKLQDALDIAMEHGDEDYTTVNIGKIFCETSSMLHAFETYCVKQASASVLLNNLEKEKELLRIFLRVSQMENTLLRRMNLPAFLMVPVQRVTRYPLLLSRLHKVTPIHHKDRNALKEAQQKVELHLEHINQQTKGVGGTKIWRRISNISASHRRLGNLQDIGNIKLRKMALEALQWKQDEARFVLAGKLLLTHPWNKKGRSVKFTPLHALLIALGKPNANYRPEIAENAVLFPRNTGIRDASLVLTKEKSGRFIVDPLFLGNCVISSDSEAEDVFEVQEYTTKEAYLLKGENKKETKEWLRQLRYHAKDLGSWRKRRNALANIMINGMIRQ